MNANFRFLKKNFEKIFQIKLCENIPLVASEKITVK